ncbi:MAG TPA: hypothetical protein VHG28_24065 [Longimicrobiaceae bacterium]|nr:hypothetical protein [Longimicrobiaceae bacterium]
MSRPALRFWGWALGVAAGIAVGAALLLPYEALGLRSEAERERAWLLTVWTAGVLTLLFGLSARLGAARGVGVREVLEAGSVREAMESRRRAERTEVARGFDVWVMTVGGLLIGIYFAGWILLTR